MKLLIGKVASNKNKNTIVVEVERFFKHPIYEKRIRRTKRFQVHTEGTHNIGEVVRFVSTRPISKMKKWKVVSGEKENKK